MKLKKFSSNIPAYLYQYHPAKINTPKQNIDTNTANILENVFPSLFLAQSWISGNAANIRIR